MKNNFNHIQTAHCENGAITGLLKDKGLDWMTEPLAFGMGGGIFYLYIPYITINGGPFITFRSFPGSIFSKTCKSLGVPVVRKKFKDIVSGEQFVDQKLKEGTPIACQVGVYNLPYFPKEYRFHFNAHNLIVYGKEGDDYLISDPVMEFTTKLSKQELTKVRFSKGALAPKGHVYYPDNVHKVTNDSIRKAIKKGINKSVMFMVKAPGPIIGVSGINFTAKNIRKWRSQYGQRKAGLYLGQIVRMQEEIGTGGGGFRFIYAAFLEQAQEYIQNDQLATISDLMTKAGDLWRDSAVQMAGIYKGRLTEQSDFNNSAAILDEIASVEKEAFTRLSKLKL